MYYLGFYFYLGVVRPADQQNTATGRIYSHSLRGGVHPLHGGPPGEAPGVGQQAEGGRRRRERKKKQTRGEETQQMPPVEESALQEL